MRIPLIAHICITSKPGAHLPNSTWGFPFYIAMKRDGHNLGEERVVIGCFKKTAMVGKLGQVCQVCIQMPDNLIRQVIYIIKCWIR